jgi:hypothetical protein
MTYVIQGLAVSMFLWLVGVPDYTVSWWAAMIGLNVAILVIREELHGHI